MTDELCFLTVAEAARRIAKRDLSPVELTDAYLARVATHDGVLRSYIRVTPEAALAAARQAEAEIMGGGPRGPLHGIPFALKDIFDSAGLPTTGHSARCVDNIAVEDAETTARLKAAGAVPLGKLATHEFATGGPSWDLPFPPARNPWDLTRFPGGSSSGSGVAVAAGLAPGAMGSDTGGSIRLPAAFCGTAGLKPSYGRVSKRGVLPLSYTLDNAGPLAWTVEDCAILLQAIAGHDPRDPASADLPVPDYRAELRNGINGLRIGLVRHWYETDRRASDPTIAAMDAAVSVLRGLGAEVREVTLHPLAAYQATMRVTPILIFRQRPRQLQQRLPNQQRRVLRLAPLVSNSAPGDQYGIRLVLRKTKALKDLGDKLSPSVMHLENGRSLHAPLVVDLNLTDI
jgi:aspartyl-tRNA(Asn)/glutamyl-tRNA(Gln) amidotransferase subunit A